MNDVILCHMNVSYVQSADGQQVKQVVEAFLWICPKNINKKILAFWMVRYLRIIVHICVFSSVD